MKRLGEAGDAAERAAEAAIARVPAWQGRAVAYELAVAPVASPMQRGVDSFGWLVEIDGAERAFLKTPAPEAHRFIDWAAAAGAARLAAEAGVAPRLLWSDPGLGAAAWEHLGPAWATAMLADLASPQVLPQLIAAKRALHRGPRFPRSRSVFDLVEAYAAEAMAGRAPLPEDYASLLESVREVARAITAAGMDEAPCHGDGIASNVMIGPAGAVRLVDWDEAANADPYWDLGSLFAEAFPFDPAARAALELYAGRADEALLARCRLYGIADDLAWATRSMIAAATSERVDVEFFKYGQWRFLRCRMELRDRRFEERLRAL